MCSGCPLGEHNHAESLPILQTAGRQSKQPLGIVGDDTIDAHGFGGLDVGRFVDGVDEDSERLVVKRLEK